MALGLPEASTPPDRVTMVLEFSDGSTGTIHYLSNGNKGFPKERIEVFAGGRILHLDNFRTLRGWGWPRLRTRTTWRQDKGNVAAVAAFCRGIETGEPAIPVSEILEVSRFSIHAQDAVSRPGAG